MAAAAREVLSIAVDVGPSMCAGGGARRSAALLVATAALQQKLLYARRDEVALLLAGTAGTANTAPDPVGYEHITEMTGGTFTRPTVELVRRLHALHKAPLEAPRGGAGAALNPGGAATAPAAADPLCALALALGALVNTASYNQGKRGADSSPVARGDNN